MRRHQPAVKRGREQFATVLCERFLVRHPFSGRRRNRGSLTTPPEPPSALASARQRLCGGSAARQSIGPAFLQPSRPARCDVHRPATQIDPCPGGGGGQGIECLSDERFQLILLQARAEFPFHTLSHLLPGPSGCFHLLEHVECLC
jgi:hypothetical protein